MTERKAAIVGTAQTWKLAPWNDLSVDIFGLNDGYALGWRVGLPGLPRASGWYDLHPFEHMSFQPKGKTRVSQADVPVGASLRPEGHLQWLRSQAFPVYVNTVPAGWPDHVKAFPRAEIEAKHGTYFTSTPAWMLVHLIEQGYTEIQIFGIHLATQWEYQAQRPGMEFWMRYAIDRGIKIVLPEKCPLLKSKHVYAYEPKPDIPLQAMEQRIAQIKQEGAKLQQQLQRARFWQRGDLQARLDVVNLELADAKHAYGRVQQAVLA
jgi:hypothetical protein